MCPGGLSSQTPFVQKVNVIACHLVLHNLYKDYWKVQRRWLYKASKTCSQKQERKEKRKKDSTDACSEAI